MAERGEWSGTLGGSNSRTSVTPFPGVSKVKTPHQSPSSEGICGSKHILPIRKRKLPDPERQDNPLAEEISSPVYRDSLQSNVADPNSPLSKRRRVVSENSILKDQKSEERTSTVRQKKRLSNQGCNTPRRLTVGENTSNFSSESEPSKLRRTSRGTYHLGFYAESQQQYFAAFRSQTSKLKSRGQSPEEVDLLTVRPSHRRTSLPEGGSLHLRSAIVKRHSLSSQLNKRNLASKDRGSNKAKNIKLSKKKMTERKSSWNSTEGKEFYKVKELADETESIHITADSSPRCAKLRVSRRHTLPGRPDLDQSMGVNLSKCLSVKPNEADGSLNRVIDFSTEPKPSTSGLSTNGEYISNSASTVLNQIIRKLPRKKKSISEQDLSQVEPSHPSVNIDPKKAEKFPVSILKKPQEVKRRRSIYLDNQNKDSFVSNGNELTPTHSPLSNEKTPCSNVFKSTYPLRNRLKIADDFNSKLSPSTCGGGGGVSSISTTLLNNSLPATSSFTSTTTSFTAQSLSLPSSPSSPGMPFLDTFRRLRDSRRMSSEQSQNNTASSTKALKDVKLGSAWKRGHALRKSSMSSKLGSRGKSNSTGTNPCSRYNLAASDQLPLQMAIASGGTVLPMAPSIAPNVISSTAASGLLPPSVLSSHGAVGSAGTGATGITDPGGSSASTGSSGMSLGLMGIPGDSESEESEMGRLEALLASRGLPPSLFGALGPRMQHILHRSVSTSISSKAQQLLVGLQATGDEGEQLQAVIEMCQLLVMGNEDTLAGFPIKQVTPALIALLNMEHNFDMMNHACRALTYMMEALPRSSAVVVEAVPAFLEKLQAIQCMDVAEQSLTALNMLSRKHSKAILQARGVSACLTYIDFFSTNAQRAALSITANCFQNLTSEEFHFASDALPILSSRLTTQGDKKCVESVCLAFSRLVDCFQSDPVKLQEIASHGLLTNTQQLLVMSPPVLSSKTFIMVIRMLSLMCMHCPELAVTLLENNIAQTLCYLLTNSTELPSEQVELVARSPQELYEITCLIGELMPVLPSDGVFAVDSVIQLPHVSTQETVSWQWQDDRGQWHGYAASDSKIIELAHQSGEDEISVCVNGNAYTLDFHSMQQINDNTGTMRSIMRQILPAGVSGTPSNQNTCMDARDKCLKEDKVLAMTLIKSLFNLLYEVYSSSAGPAVRYKSLRALLRMVHFCSPDLLQQVLKNQLVSSHLATMLSSQDLKIIVSSLQMADLLMQKLPHVFSIYFRREGVMHQIKRLKESDALIPLGSASNLSTPRSSSDSPSAYDCSLLSSLTVADSTPQSSNAIPPLPPGLPLYNGEQAVGEGVGMEGASPSLSISDPSGAVNNGDGPKGNSPQLRFADVLKRKRSKGMARASSVGGWRRGNRQEDPVASPTFGEFIIKNAGFNAGRDTWRGIGGGRSKVTSGTSPNSSKGAASFLSNFNPVRWGRGSSTSTPPVHDPSLLSKEKCGNLSGFSPSPSSQMVTNATRDYVRNWIKDQAKRLTDQYFSSEAQGYNHPALSVMNRLIRAIQLLDSDPENAIGPLRDISFIMRDSDISPFEVIHSGLVRALLNYLTASEEDKAAPASSASSFILSSLAAGEGILGTVASAAYSSVCSELGAKAKPSETASTNKAAKLPRDVRLRNFLNVFLGCSIDPLSLDGFDMSMVPTFSSLVSKLNGCVNQLEQFPVKVHDLPGSLHGGSSRGGSTSAIKFFNTHQLKCSLQRHPECTRLKQWRGGPVKVDPLALVQAIERYLVIRGYGRLRDEDEDNSDDENSEEDIDDTLAAVSVSHNSTNHKLEFLIGDRLLPYNMTVYQAVRQFASSDNSNGDVEVEAEIPIAHSSIWLQTHTIYYRPVSEEPSKHQSGRKGKSTTKPSPKKKSEAGQSKWGITSAGNCVLDGQMSAQLPATVTVKDPSLEVLALLRVLNALNRHYSSLYPPTSFPTPSLSSSSPLPIPSAEFNNVKLTAKANRQLQDPLVIMTANLPQWLPQIAYACPFLFPFETRQLLFYAVSFDRDRALQRLMDSTPELNSSDSSERVTPRLERRKRTVSRDDILKQAETVIGDMASSRAMLEIQYENEVGTGLGPTLEFYALVSQDLLRADLELWRGETVSVEKEAEFSQKTVKYIADTSGVYPLPLARNMKSSLVTKVKNKFKFLGKFMAKAVMDSRMLDLNLHESVYKWILSEEKSLCLRDILSMDQSVGQTLLKLQKVVIQKKIIQDEGKKSNANGQQLQEGYDALTVDGCKVEDLCLNFTLPGYPNIELKKGGSDIDVTVNNIEQYLQLVIEWMLKDGVWRQMEALREGFESVFPTSQLRVFYPEEMEQLFCGASYTKSWDVQYLAECCRPDHGYTHESKSLKFLLQVLSEYTTTHQRSFLQFVTGSPRLPVGGFKSLSPPLTIVKKTFEAGENPDNFLPSVMTCVNYLKLPDYSSIDTMREKLQIAYLEGRHSFHLS